MIILKNYKDLTKEILKAENNTTIIIAKYNHGKSSIITDKIINLFKKDKPLYATFIDQSKPGFIPRKSDLDFNKKTKDKIIIFDEISDDKDRDINKYIKDLIKNNKLIILTNPYGDCINIKKEKELIIKYENLNKNTKFIYIQEKI